MMSMRSIASEAARSPVSRLIIVAKDTVSVVLAMAMAGSLCQVANVLDRNPFGWHDTAELGVALLCAFASWGFFRLMFDLLQADGIMSRHSGLVAWWLVGGVWVTASAVGLVVESPSHDSNAVMSMIYLGGLLAVALLPPLLILCLGGRERTQAGWREWLGFLAGCMFPIHFALFLKLRS